MVKTALIVDDSRLARLTLKRLLNKYDIEVAEAEGVLDAEMWLSRNPLPDIVFMDIMMPELDGYEGLARLRAEPETRSLPVIMYSGDISDEARKKARDAGATGYLPKPADANRLDHLLTALQERMRSENKTPSAPANKPIAPPPPPSAKTAPAPARPSFDVSSAEQEFGLNTGSGLAPTQATISLDPNSEPDPVPAEPLTPAPAAGISAEESRAIKSRLEILEQDIARVHSIQQKLDEKVANTSQLAPAEIDRHHKDLIALQSKIAECEKQSKLALMIGSGGLALAVLSIIWHMF